MPSTFNPWSNRLLPSSNSQKQGSYIWPDEDTADAYYAANPSLLVEGAERKVALQINEFDSSYLAIGVP